MRCEIGLLTRNVKYQGSADTPASLHGAHIMFMGSEKDGTIARISYSEFYNVG